MSAPGHAGKLLAARVARALASSRATAEIQVAWGEMDALGHVNNVAYFRYLETSRVRFIESVGWGRLNGEAAPNDDDRPGFILQSAECRFRRPVVYPDTLRVTARCVSVDVDRFTLEHEVISTAQSEIAAIGRSVIVTYDYRSGLKTAMPEGLARALRGE